MIRPPISRASLRLFCADYPQASGYLMYGGTRRYTFDRITVLPFGEALAEIPEQL